MNLSRRSLLKLSGAAIAASVALPSFAQAIDELVIAYNVPLPSWDPTTGPSAVIPSGDSAASRQLNRRVEILGAGHALLDHPRRLVHRQRLDARHDVAGHRVVGVGVHHQRHVFFQNQWHGITQSMFPRAGLDDLQRKVVLDFLEKNAKDAIVP